MTPKSNRLQPWVAAKALRRLIADPEQTHEVFTIIRALSGNALEQGFVRFRNTKVGHCILSQELDILDTLKNRSYLATLPPGSLGQHYLSFVSSENLTADGLVDASSEIEEVYQDDEHKRFGSRLRDTHDLWHTLTQYGRDELGEACLLAFTYAQNKNRGIGVICFIGCLKLSQFYGAGVFKAAWRAYNDGKNAAWLPAQDWEALLKQPIHEVRRTLNITPPDNYQNLRAEFATA